MSKQKQSFVLPTYHNQKPLVDDSILEQPWKCKYRILFLTLLMFLGSLWIVSAFSYSSLDMHVFDKYHDNAAAMAAASVMGEGGEEGLYGLDFELHSGNDPLSHNPFAYYDGDDDYYYYDYLNENDNENEDEYDEEDDWEGELETELEKEIYDIIQDYSIVVFSKTYCPYSRRAKHILAQYGVTPYVVEVDTRDDAEDVKWALFKFTYQATFPNIFIDGKSVGGSDELAILHNNGRLKELLIDAGEVDYDDGFEYLLFLD